VLGVAEAESFPTPSPRYSALPSSRIATMPLGLGVRPVLAEGFPKRSSVKNKTQNVHRAMFLPRPATRGRLLSWSAKTNLASKIRWASDALGNNITVLEFADPSDELTFTFRFCGVHYGAKAFEEVPLEPRAEKVPVRHTPDEWTTLVSSWALMPRMTTQASSLGPRALSLTTRIKRTNVLRRMLDIFQDAFSYNAREAEGTQTPGETLHTRSGTCRDYPWLTIEALRWLGFAARGVSDYLYDGALDGGQAGMIGSGATHAWVQVYLPAAGYDLIPVSIARHPEQAIPLAGSWCGKAQGYLGMTVSVAVHQLADVSDPSEESQ
jgi:hypothetical protein